MNVDKKIKNLAQYHYQVLHSLLQVDNKPLFNILDSKKEEWVDVSVLMGEEQFFTKKIVMSFVGTERGFRELRLLYQSFLLNKEKRDIYYGFPFILKRAQSEVFLAPLFFVPLKFDVNIRGNIFRITAASDELQVNYQLLSQLAGRETTSAIGSLLGKEGYPTIPIRRDDFWNILASIKRFLDEPKLDKWDWKLMPIQLSDDLSDFVICPMASIFTLRKGLYFTLEDLGLISKSEIDYKGSVLEILFEEGKGPIEDTKFYLNPPVFPLPANERQIQVGLDARTHRLIVVQGPPGTGKSWTITNLVADLVANGRSVLVTSEKKKALEVVMNKLSSLGIKYLYFPLLRKDKVISRLILEILETLEINWEKITSGASLDLVNTLHRKRQSILNELENKKAKFDKYTSKIQEKLNLIEEYYTFYHEYDILPKDVEIDEIVLSKFLNNFADLLKKREEIQGVMKNKESLKIIRYLIAQRENPVDIYKRVSELKRQIESFDPRYQPVLRKIYSVYKSKEKFESLYRYHLSVLSDLEKNLEKIRGFLVSEGIGEVKKLEQLIKSVLISIREFNESLEQINRLVEEYILWSHKGILGRIVLLSKNLQKKLKNDIRGLPLSSVQQQELITQIIQNKNQKYWVEFYEKIKKYLIILSIRTKVNNLIRNLDIKEFLGNMPIEELAFQTELIENIKSSLRFCKIYLDLLPYFKLFGLPSNSFENLISVKDTTLLDSLQELLNKIEHDYMFYASYIETLQKFPFSLRGWIHSFLEDNNSTKNEELVNHFKKILTARLYWGKLNKVKNVCEIQDSNQFFREFSNLQSEFLKLNGLILKYAYYSTLREGMRGRLGAEVSSLKKLLKRGGRRRQKLEYLKQFIDYQVLLKGFPVWIVDTDEVSRIFPLKPGLFDYIIMDESSQTSQVCLLPLLIRAKKAIIVGDEKQLPHYGTIFLDRFLNQEWRRRYHIDRLPKGYIFDAAEYSFLDVAEIWAEKKLLLIEHFRSLPGIIDFCNKRFYNNQLIILTGGKQEFENIFEFKFVEDAVEQNKINRKEAELIIEDLISRLKNPQYKDKTFGILSLFRDQSDYIRDLLHERILREPELLELVSQLKEPLVVSTVDGFQGDERDIIFYSFRYALNSSPHIFVIQNDERRINVALTRAREKMVLYLSRPIDEFPPGIVKDFLNYAWNYRKQPQATEYHSAKPPTSKSIQRLLGLLRENGFRIVSQFPYDSMIVDLVVLGENTKIALEIDGFRHAGEIRDDLQRHLLLLKGGWTVLRVSVFDVWEKPHAILNNLKGLLSNH